MARLNREEMELWSAWKDASEAVRASVGADITAATGLSDPDFGVLSRLTDLGHGKLRQSELASSMGWHRSRLSHHLTRMEQRGLISRHQGSEGGVEVRITTAGSKAIGDARPVHAEAVRKHLIEPLSARQRDALRLILGRLDAQRPADRPS